MPKPYLRNLIAILSAGVLLSAWFLFYTDWFEVVGGLLALGGILSWLAFVSKLLPDERLKQLQTRFDQRVMCNPGTSATTLAILVALLFVAACFGTIELKTRPRAGEYLVSVRSAGDRSPEKDADFVTIAAGASDRTVRFAFWRNLVVHVKGYPAVTVSATPFRRRTLIVPDSLIAPVVLLRPATDLIDASTKNNKILSVVVADERGVGGKTYTMEFDGTAVWVGCDDDVEVPPRLYEPWQHELAAGERTAYFRRWAHPRSLFRESAEGGGEGTPSPPLRLVPGQTLSVTLFKKEAPKEVFAGPFHIKVETRARWEEFPQVVDLLSK